MRKQEGILFDDEKDKDILNHLAAQPNKSFYVRELIRQDMSNTLEKSIKKCIDEYLKNKNITTTQSGEETHINMNDIKNILNMQ